MNRLTVVYLGGLGVRERRKAGFDVGSVGRIQFKVIDGEKQRISVRIPQVRWDSSATVELGNGFLPAPDQVNTDLLVLQAVDRYRSLAP